MEKCRVVSKLGHCGAEPNEYVDFTGTKKECEKFFSELPKADEGDFCQHCGGYSGTGTVQDVASIEEEHDENFDPEYSMIESNLSPDIRYHDDMYQEEVNISPFTFRPTFGDFRIFNGVPLGEMDVLLRRLATLMNEIDEAGATQDIHVRKAK